MGGFSPARMLVPALLLAAVTLASASREGGAAGASAGAPAQGGAAPAAAELYPPLRKPATIGGTLRWMAGEPCA
jgi:trimeric autotransporter adhesin